MKSTDPEMASKSSGIGPEENPGHKQGLTFVSFSVTPESSGTDVASLGSRSKHPVISVHLYATTECSSPSVNRNSQWGNISCSSWPDKTRTRDSRSKRPDKRNKYA
ncbi:hypothetical protein Bpfe_008423 [Biomphalaria pfeifferi]|uniref:Uncharacterized protein n=1 Tax=Biomphalaria pfeifferi TaxID=112525 RepID=A0AAD8BWW4_BIOPF|nr:hypothetical protein Bpfe_008423 [Biomphalaria pfeifferi]